MALLGVTMTINMSGMRGLDHKAQTTEAGHLMSPWLSSPKSNNQKQKRQKGAVRKKAK
ncbi:uncharacterized protein Dere_GG26305 [Drosophila erecta]|nr:uncharacterized protein Dere_GG26305 [Drosophila erecta]